MLPIRRRATAMTHPMNHTRRGFLGLSAATATALGLAACGGGTQPGESPDGDGGGGGGEANAWILTGGMWPVRESSFERWNEANSDQEIALDRVDTDADPARNRPRLEPA